MKIKYLMITLLFSTLFETSASADVLNTLSSERSFLSKAEEQALELLKVSGGDDTDNYATDDEEEGSDDLSPSAYEALEKFENKYFSKSSRYSRKKPFSKEEPKIGISQLQSKRTRGLEKVPSSPKK